MATLVAFRNERTGEIKSLKVGWSWVLFLFGPVLGIPFFIRKHYPLAFMMIAWDIVCAILPQDQEWGIAIVRGGAIGLAIGLGKKGNKLTAEYYLKHGWELVDPESENAIIAREKWALA